MFDQWPGLWQNTNELHLPRLHFGFARATKIAAAALCVALVFGLSLLAACPALHELIHHDACDPDHECAITLFAHGQVNLAETVVPIVQRPEPVAAFVQTWREICFVSTDVPLHPGRGPPSPLPLHS
ncbi:MAG: hypothetical protein ABSF38_04750 [Verrucomicrobiota bacterium]|jgi:hypothetical protein